MTAPGSSAAADSWPRRRFTPARAAVEAAALALPALLAPRPPLPPPTTRAATILLLAAVSGSLAYARCFKCDRRLARLT